MKFAQYTAGHRWPFVDQTGVELYQFGTCLQFLLNISGRAYTADTDDGQLIVAVFRYLANEVGAGLFERGAA